MVDEDPEDPLHVHKMLSETIMGGETLNLHMRVVIYLQLSCSLLN